MRALEIAPAVPSLTGISPALTLLLGLQVKTVAARLAEGQAEAYLAATLFAVGQLLVVGVVGHLHKTPTERISATHAASALRLAWLSAHNS